MCLYDFDGAHMTTVLVDADGAPILFDDGSAQALELGYSPTAVTGMLTFSAKPIRREFTEKPAVKEFSATQIRRQFI